MPWLNLMDSLMLEKIKELLGKNETIGIGVGKNPGIDEMGAALSLYLALTEAGKKVTVASPTEPIVEISSLVGIDRVKKGFAGNDGDFIVSFPYNQESNEIEKISYVMEDDSLNIIVKPTERGLSFTEKDVRYKRGGGAPGLIFVVGTARLSDLGTIFDPEALKDSKIINIDYKIENQGYGDIPLLGKNASSVSELVTSFLSSLNFNIDIDIAQNLLSGIISATENFQNPQTSSLSFEMAGVLMKKGAVRQINRKKQNVIEEDSFFSPKSQPRTPSFPKTTIGTEEKKAVFAKEGFGEPQQEVKLDEDNPPDDWLAPKIYKGSTAI